MTLIERYLKAVAAQLPAADREDIVAELRDELMARLEAREAALGRAPTEGEVEAVLREMGHPLAVAARFGAGPHHVVGPELFPWWTFGVKAALVVLALITVVGAVARVLAGDMDAGQAVAQAFAGLFSGALTVVGLATIAAFIIERQKERPAFLTRWRVRDLGLFEVGLFGGGWTARARAAAVGDAPETAPGPAPGPGPAPTAPAEMSPTARAVASAVGWGVFLLWWTGVLGLGFRPGDLGGRLVLGGIDYGALVAETVTLAYWPVTAYAAALVAFNLIRAALGAPVRFTAVGDLVFGVIALGFIGWFWLRSPFAEIVAVDTVRAYVERIADMIQTGEAVVPTVLMMTVSAMFLGEVLSVLRAMRRLLLGR